MWAIVLPDHLGSVRQLANTSGEITLGQSYTPFGEVMESAGSGESAFGFTGEQQNGEMVYLRARYYTPGVGRFMSRDPWRGIDQKPVTLHGHSYTYNNPLRYTDPSGYDGGLGATITITCSVGAPACIQAALEIGGVIVSVGPVAIASGVLFIAIAVPVQECIQNPDVCQPVPAPPAPTVPPIADPTAEATPDILSPEQLQELWDNGPAIEPDRGPKPTVRPLPTPVPLPTCTPTPDPQLHLYHYTDRRGYRGIQSSRLIFPSGTGRRGFATHGPGQYFTDLSPTGLLTKVEYSYALFNSPNVKHKTQYWFLIDLTGLPVTRVQNLYGNNISPFRRSIVNRSGLYLRRGRNNIPARIISQGRTTYHPGP